MGAVTGVPFGGFPDCLAWGRGMGSALNKGILENRGGLVRQKKKPPIGSFFRGGADAWRVKEKAAIGCCSDRRTRLMHDSF